VPPVVAGILTMSASYSACLLALRSPNLAVDSSATVFAPLDRFQERVGPMTFAGMAIYPLFFLLLLMAAKGLLDRYLVSERGIELRAAGSNVLMASSHGVNPDSAARRGLALANSLVGLSGALFAQKERFADVNMGFGILVVGLASVFIGQTVEMRLGSRVAAASLAVIFGALAHRFSVAIAYEVGLRTEYFNAFTSVIVLAAVCMPNVRLGVCRLLRRAV
jgi:putative tryptophan/tyrosine transport system permease protein